MLGSSVALLLVALAAVRFPELSLLAILPAAIGAGIASVIPPERGAWITGILAGAFLARLPGGLLLGVAVALAPPVAVLVRKAARFHPLLVAAVLIPVATYLAAAAGSGSFTAPFRHPLDLCAALAVGATLSILAYAPTQRERLGPRGRAGFRLR